MSFQGIIEYLLLHIGCSTALYLILNKDLEKTQKFIVKRLFIIKETQYMMNFNEFLPQEEREKFKEQYDSKDIIKIKVVHKNEKGEIEEVDKEDHRNDLFRFFIYGWIKVAFFIIVSYVIEIYRENLRQKVIKARDERIYKERLEMEAIKELKREEELNKKINGE